MTLDSQIPAGTAARAGQRIQWSASAHFDELQFSPPADVQPAYFRQVARGYDRMSRQRAVIAGLARDNAHILPLTIARIERQGSYFQDYRVVLYENDSTDTTRWLLQAWAARNPRVSIVSELRNDPVNPPTRCLSRATRMAYYRSQCQQWIAREFSPYDLVILVDTDLHGGWSYDGMAHTIGQNDWDFVGANGIIYRRLWLRPNAVVHYDAWAFRNDASFTPRTTKAVNHTTFVRGQPLEPVYSCFGGVGVYRMPAYLAGRYDGSDVEHVTFHRELHRRGFDRTFLNPNLIAVYGRKHRSWDPAAARLIRLINRLTHRSDVPWYYGNGDAATIADSGIGAERSQVAS
jgi:hypothetical protein